MAGEVFVKLFPRNLSVETLNFFQYGNKLLSSILMFATPRSRLSSQIPRQIPEFEIMKVTESNKKVCEQIVSGACEACLSKANVIGKHF